MPTREKIIIVEDEMVIALEIDHNLKRLGYTVAGIVDTGEDAIRMAEEVRPDLMMMDIHIKGDMDGIETATNITERFETPIIFLTAYSDEDMLERSKDALPYAYLLKPVQERDLKVAVSMALYSARINTERKAALTQVIQMREKLEQLVEERTKELKSAMEEAKEANKSKSDFLHKVSHEIRTPIHHMINFANFGFQKTGIIENKTIKTYFQSIGESAHELEAMLNDLLDHAKLEAGKTEYHFDQTDLRKIAIRAIMECQPTAEERKIKLDLNHSENDFMLFCDSQKIKQVFLNILSNALKFSPDSSVVTVNLDLEKPVEKAGVQAVVYKISILDQGLGIPEEELETVFQMFYQVANRTPNVNGTGLGLAICEEIIIGHGGKIWAENRQPQGAILSFTLPCEQPSR